MNHDDETFLSAFIDGELAPDQQQRVESALVANPHLAARLRGLSQVRDLVAGLPHDGSVDVTARVMQQIHARSRERGFLPTLEGWRRGSRRILPLAGLAASAASLMVAASLAILMQATRLENAGQSVGQLAHVKAPAGSNPTASQAPLENGGQTGASAIVPSSSPHSELTGTFANGLAAAASGSAIATGAGADFQEPAAGDALGARQFLDSPNPKRFFWISGGTRNDSEPVVASIVERTTRFDFFKITVAQGIVIDPRHPGEATVLAFVIDPDQVDRFNDQLKAALPGLVEQEALDPVIATQLAEIERVHSFPAGVLGEVEIPREALALRTKSSVGSEKVHGGEGDGPAAPRDGGRAGAPSERDAEASPGALGSSGSGVVAAVAGSPSGTDPGSRTGAGSGPSHPGEPAIAARSRLALEQKTVVLVWIAKPPVD
jgi:anti-sigma factor RsiW